MPRTAAGYCRYSSDRQNESSIEAQELALREWASRNGVIIVRMYYDRAFSGTSDNRPDFLRMIADLKTHPVDLVLVHKQDRFARNRYDAAVYQQEIKKRGARLVAVAQDFGEGNEAVLLEALMQGLAEYYSKNLSSEVIKGRRIRIRAGKHASGVHPLGYTIDADGYYQIVELEAYYIRKLYQCVFDNTPYTPVIEEMRAAGIIGRKKGQLRVCNVSKILRNPIYTGLYRARAGDEIIEYPDNHPAIIDKQTYQEAMHIMDTRRNAGRRPQQKYLLKGLITCGECGSNLTGHNVVKQEKTHRYYDCPSCRLRAVPCLEVEQAACAYLAQLLSPELRVQLSSAVEDYISGQMSSSKQRAAQNARQIRALRTKIDTLIANMSSGVLAPIVLERLSKEITSLEEQIKVLEQISAPPPTISRAQIDAYFADAAAVSPDDDPQMVSAMLHRFISKVSVFSDHFEFESTFNGYFQSLLSDPARAASSPAGPTNPSAFFASSPSSSSPSVSELRNAVRSSARKRNQAAIQLYFFAHIVARQPIKKPRQVIHKDAENIVHYSQQN